MLLITLLAGCVGWDPNSNVCGTLDYEDDVAEPDALVIVTIAPGHEACEGVDTGEDTDGPWWDETVAEPEIDRDRFEATVPVGSYAVEAIGSGFGGCVGFEVPETSQCAAEPVLPIHELISVDKPNLYLYPATRQRIDVRLPAWRRITAAAPDYPVTGWRVVADPHGRLQTQAGPRGYLFYELAWEPERFQTDEGWCADGDQAQASIEGAMEDLGFNAREIADFAEGWDADFPLADEVTVYPQLDGLAELRIDPPPDAMLRAWFYVVDGCRPVAEPELPAPPVGTFRAAEWGVAFGEGLEPGDVMVEGRP